MSVESCKQILWKILGGTITCLPEESLMHIDEKGLQLVIDNISENVFTRLEFYNTCFNTKDVEQLSRALSLNRSIVYLGFSKVEFPNNECIQEIFNAVKGLTRLNSFDFSLCKIKAFTTGSAAGLNDLPVFPKLDSSVKLISKNHCFDKGEGPLALNPCCATRNSLNFPCSESRRKPENAILKVSEAAGLNAIDKLLLQYSRYEITSLSVRLVDPRDRQYKKGSTSLVKCCWDPKSAILDIQIFDFRESLRVLSNVMPNYFKKTPVRSLKLVLDTNNHDHITRLLDVAACLKDLRELSVAFIFEQSVIKEIHYLVKDMPLEVLTLGSSDYVRDRVPDLFCLENINFAKNLFSDCNTIKYLNFHTMDIFGLNDVTNSYRRSELVAIKGKLVDFDLFISKIYGYGPLLEELDLSFSSLLWGDKRKKLFECLAGLKNLKTIRLKGPHSNSAKWPEGVDLFWQFKRWDKLETLVWSIELNSDGYLLQLLKSVQTMKALKRFVIDPPLCLCNDPNLERGVYKAIANFIRESSVVESLDIRMEPNKDQVSEAFQDIIDGLNGNCTLTSFVYSEGDIVCNEINQSLLINRKIQKLMPADIYSHEQRKMVKLLIVKDQAIKSIRKGLQSILHIAAQHDHPELLNCLISYGVSPDLQDENGDTALHIALRNGFFGCAMVLLKLEADIDIRNNNRECARHFIWRSENKETYLKTYEEQFSDDSEDENEYTYQDISICDTTRHHDILEKNTRELSGLADKPLRENLDQLQGFSEFYLPHYRGVHFFPSLGSKGRRKEVAKKTVVSPIYASEATQAGSDKGSKGKELIRLFHELKHGEPVESYWTSGRNRFKFDSPYYLLAQRYSNSYTEFHKDMTGKSNRSKKESAMIESIFSKIKIRCNPFISTSHTPGMAVKYGVGDGVFKAKETLRANYSSSGRPRHPYLGRVYVLLHKPQDFMTSGAEHLPHLNVQKKINLNHRYLNACETVFVGCISEDSIVAQVSARMPNFKHPYRDFISQKYGLSKKQYVDLKNDLSAVKTTIAKEKIEKKVMALVQKHLKKLLLSIAERKAIDAGRCLMYVNAQGGVSPDYSKTNFEHRKRRRESDAIDMEEK